MYGVGNPQLWSDLFRRYAIVIQSSQEFGKLVRVHNLLSNTVDTNTVSFQTRKQRKYLSHLNVLFLRHSVILESCIYCL